MRVVMVGIGLVLLLAVLVVSNRIAPVHGAGNAGFAAVPGSRGGQDIFGPYDVAKDWPRNLATLPGNEKWTWGSVEGVFAESPNRIFVVQRGELPNLDRPKQVGLPELGPSLVFPVSQAPFRNATEASPPKLRPGAPANTPDVDWHFAHCVVVVDANGNIAEDWSQWDKLFTRPHSVFINPYDPQKHIWIVEDVGSAIYEFTNDGKELVKTIGTPNQPGNDETHFNGPTFLAWLPDSTLFVADGYRNQRVVKFDKNGKYLTQWGQKGNPPNDTRPGYFNTVHGVLVDQKTRRVFVNDRGNHRIQIFDENGKFLDQWSTGGVNTDIHVIHMSADRHIWAGDRATSKIIEWDLDGHLLYTWGTYGDWPGAMWGVHGMSVDQEGNFYVAEVNAGRVQKYIPRQGANPALLVGKPVYSAWK